MLWAILARGLRNLTRASLSYAPCLRAAYATLRAPAFRLTSFSFLRARLRAAYATFRQPWFSNHACSGAYAQLSLSLRSPCAKSALMQKCLRHACAPLAAKWVGAGKQGKGSCTNERIHVYVYASRHLWRSMCWSSLAAKHGCVVHSLVVACGEVGARSNRNPQLSSATP